VSGSDFEPPYKHAEERWFAGQAAKWTFFILALIATAAIAVWGFGVGTSDVKGRGDAQRIHNSATNRIFAQQNFQQRYHDIVDTDIPNVKTAKQTYKLDPSSYNLQNLTGTMQFCHSDVAGYNADAEKFLLRDFRDKGLPKRINPKKCDVKLK
jgi:malate synthase